MYVVHTFRIVLWAIYTSSGHTLKKTLISRKFLPHRHAAGAWSCGSVLLAASPASQQCFSLTPNQHQPPAISHSAVIFSHNKLAPATSRSLQNGRDVVRERKKHASADDGDDGDDGDGVEPDAGGGGSGADAAAGGSGRARGVRFTGIHCTYK